MFFWFVACGVLLVAWVFDSSGVDYRIVAAGAVLPLAENLTGAPWMLHTLTGSAVLLAVVMAVTAGRGRRLLRRRWIGLPIGTLIFLAASGAWVCADLFWWPFGGGHGVGHGVGHGPAPEFDRPLVMLIALEIVGVAALAWSAGRFGLADPQRRRLLLTSGRLAARPASQRRS